MIPARAAMTSGVAPEVSRDPQTGLPPKPPPDIDDTASRFEEEFKLLDIPFPKQERAYRPLVGDINAKPTGKAAATWTSWIQLRNNGKIDDYKMPEPLVYNQGFVENLPDLSMYLVDTFRRPLKIVEKIPKACLPAVAGALKAVLRWADVAASIKTASFILMFPFLVLQEKDGRPTSAALKKLEKSIVRRSLMLIQGDVDAIFSEAIMRAQSNENLGEARRKLVPMGGPAIEAKVTELTLKGQIANAMDVLMMGNRASARVATPEVRAVIDKKLPPVKLGESKDPGSQGRAWLSDARDPAIPVTRDDVAACFHQPHPIRVNSGCGLSRLSPLHIFQLFRADPKALGDALARMAERMLNGELPTSFITLFKSARGLVRATLTDNGQPGEQKRVGGPQETIYRVAMKILTNMARSKYDVNKLMGDVQFSCQRAGVEALFHCVEEALSKAEDDGPITAAIMLDIPNMFFELSHQCLKDAFSSFLPCLRRAAGILLVPQVVSFFNGTIVRGVNKGVWIGCHFSALIASLATVKPLRDAKAQLGDECVMLKAFADNTVAVGRATAAEAVFQAINDALAKHSTGLLMQRRDSNEILLVKTANRLREAKALIETYEGRWTMKADATGKAARVMMLPDASASGLRFLGGPLGSDDFKAHFVGGVVEVAIMKLERLGSLPAQIAIHLARVSVAQSLNHLSRLVAPQFTMMPFRRVSTQQFTLIQDLLYPRLPPGMLTPRLLLQQTQTPGNPLFIRPHDAYAAPAYLAALHDAHHVAGITDPPYLNASLLTYNGQVLDELDKVSRPQGKPLIECLVEHAQKLEARERKEQSKGEDDDDEVVESFIQDTQRRLSKPVRKRLIHSMANAIEGNVELLDVWEAFHGPNNFPGWMVPIPRIADPCIPALGGRLALTPADFRLLLLRCVIDENPFRMPEHILGKIPRCTNTMASTNSVCNQQMDARLLHATSCLPKRYPKHQRLVEKLVTTLRRAGIPAAPTGEIAGESVRADAKATLYIDEGVIHLKMDVAIVCGMDMTGAKSHKGVSKTRNNHPLPRSATFLKAVEAEEAQKDGHYLGKVSNDEMFFPVVFSTFGAVGRRARHLMALITKSLAPYAILTAPEIKANLIRTLQTSFLTFTASEVRRQLETCGIFE